MAPPKNRSIPNPFLALLAKTSTDLEPKLDRVLQASLARSASYGPEVVHMVEAVASLCKRGGKRLRPGLCVVGALAKDERADVDVAVEAGVALELLQAYFLIHDDWMDQDDERRGGPTAHVTLSKQFRSQALGERSAILAGDHAIALSTMQLSSLNMDKGRLQKVFAQFAEMQIAAVAGQQVDIIGKTKNPELTYELKTASYTVRGPLLLGAEIAGASEKTKAVLDAYSLPTGIAFQLRDDLIGVFGQPEHTGKPQGGDLKEGKNTSLVRWAIERVPSTKRAPLTGVLGNRKATKAQVARAIGLLEDCGARDAMEQRIAALKEEALGYLNPTGRANGKVLSVRAKALLHGAVTALADRTM